VLIRSTSHTDGIRDRGGGRSTWSPLPPELWSYRECCSHFAERNICVKCKQPLLRIAGAVISRRYSWRSSYGRSGVLPASPEYRSTTRRYALGAGPLDVLVHGSSSGGANALTTDGALSGKRTSRARSRSPDRRGDGRLLHCVGSVLHRRPHPRRTRECVVLISPVPAIPLALLAAGVSIAFEGPTAITATSAMRRHSCCSCDCSRLPSRIRCRFARVRAMAAPRSESGGRTDRCIQPRVGGPRRAVRARALRWRGGNNRRVTRWLPCGSRPFEPTFADVIGRGVPRSTASCHEALSPRLLRRNRAQLCVAPARPNIRRRSSSRPPRTRKNGWQDRNHCASGRFDRRKRRGGLRPRLAEWSRERARLCGRPRVGRRSGRSGAIFQIRAITESSHDEKAWVTRGPSNRVHVRDPQDRDRRIT
jgi:hypothetical protein